MANSVTLTLETVAEGYRMRVRAGGGTESVLDTGPGRVAPSPVEMLIAALGGCGAMDVIGILRKKRQRVTAYEVTVTGDRRVDHPRSFTRIEIVHRVRGRDLNAAAIEEAIMLSDTKYCSVYATLAPSVELVSRYEIIPDGAG